MRITVLSPAPTRRVLWLQQAQIIAHPLRLPSGEPFPLPPLSPPLLLDTPGLEPLLLCRLLARLPPELPTVALVTADDLVAQHLLPLCPAVMLLCTPQTDPLLLATWLDLLSDLPPTQATPTGPCLLDPALTAPVFNLPPTLLTLLPALAEAETWDEAAQQIGFSPRHLRRLVRSLRGTLPLPPYRLHPRAFGQQVLRALAAGGEAAWQVGG